MRHNEPTFELVFRGASVTTAHENRLCDIGISDGKILAMRDVSPQEMRNEHPADEPFTGRTVITLADDEVLIPGLVDTHVHVNEPGRTPWEGFTSATKAAAAGAVTSIIDMPLNSIPPTVTLDALTVKRESASTQLFVNVGFWGGAIPGNEQDIEQLNTAGVFGFKSFLVDSGVEEFPAVSIVELEKHMENIASLNSISLVHAEDADIIRDNASSHSTHYEDFLRSRPRSAENFAIAAVIDAAKKTGVNAHILHLSSADSLPLIASAKKAGVRITTESCPHYLTLSSEEIADGETAYKCCPPIREESNRERLWLGLLDGTIDMIVSDHSPSTLDLKDLSGGDFQKAWGGISSLQLGLSLIWTEAKSRSISLNQVLKWMAFAPANMAGLGHKGRIEEGADADLAIFAKDASFTVRATELWHKNHLTPYEGKTLQGRIRRTFLAGKEVDFVTPHGKLLHSPPHP